MTANFEGDTLVARIDAILPQTQCKQCTYNACKPYAEAIATGEADINQCPPGGEAGVHALADLLGVAYKPLNPEHGAYKVKAVALIDEAVCIGCTLCIQACPVDAILGAAKLMHTVITSECTGCELCLPPCPVDCISMEPIAEVPLYLKQKAADLARERYNFRLSRIEREALELAQKYAERTQAKKAGVTASASNA
jgi:electron transport complex protein RnfB